jgi:hypothetical protein
MPDLPHRKHNEPMNDEPTYETIDEAIAVALSELEPGGVLVLHHETCGLVDDESECTCIPMELTVGAQA